MNTRSKTRTDHYQMIVAQIIEQLANNVLPWHPRWRLGQTVAKPRRENGVPYQGINVLSLWLAAAKAGYRSSYWMTFRQAKELGGCVRKGETATHVFFAKELKPRVHQDDEEDSRPKRYVRRAYAVFNVDQIDGLPARYATHEPPVNPDVRDQTCADWFAKLGFTIVRGAMSAAYSPHSDIVMMPRFEDFKSANAYYATLAHEVVHATGAEHRLNRELATTSGSIYAREELVAELGSAFLCADFGLNLTPRLDHASYIASWLKLLRDEPSALANAASKAQQAVEYLHRRVAEADATEKVA